MKEGVKSAHQYQAKPNTNARFANSQPHWGEGKNGNECQRNCTKQKSKNAYETTRKQKNKRIPKTITMYTCICTNAHKMNEQLMITPRKIQQLRPHAKYSVSFQRKLGKLQAWAPRMRAVDYSLPTV